MKHTFNCCLKQGAAVRRRLLSCEPVLDSGEVQQAALGNPCQLATGGTTEGALDQDCSLEEIVRFQPK